MQYIFHFENHDLNSGIGDNSPCPAVPNVTKTIQKREGEFETPNPDMMLHLCSEAPFSFV